MAEDKDKKKTQGGSLPDKDKGAGAGSEDDQLEIPDMGGGVDLEEGDTGGEAGQAPLTEPLDLATIPEFQEVARKKGFKSAADIVEALKSLEQQNTKLSQELRVSKLQATLPASRPMAGPEPQPARRSPRPTDPYELVQSPEKFNKFLDEYDAAVEERVVNRIRKEENDKEYDKAYRQANALMAKDPEKFEKLRPIMHQLSLQDPNANLEELYAKAETKRKEDIEELRKEVFGDIDPDRLKVIAAKAKPANISGASGGGQQATAGTGNKTAEQLIKEAILGSDKLSD